MPENEYCQSNRMTVYLGSIYAYKGLLMVRIKAREEEDEATNIRE